MALELVDGSIFLHVPKTGGSWVTHVLEEQGLVRRAFGHIHADMVRVRFFNPSGWGVARSAYDWAKGLVPTSLKKMAPAQSIKRASQQTVSAREPYRFCFVRHPLGWYESWWKYMTGLYGEDWTAARDIAGAHSCAVLRDLGSSDFSTFVANVNRVRPGFVTELFGRYTQLGIDFIGKQESLVDDLVSVLRERGIAFDESGLRGGKRVNKSRFEGTLEWDPAVRAETLKLEYAGLVRFGYED